MFKYLLLALAFIAAVVGGAFGASLNDVVLMSVYMLPGTFGILGLMFTYRNAR